MAGANEIELKLELDPADAGALRGHPLLAGTTASTKEQTSTYFDTRKNALRRAGYSLRIRRSGGEFVQTVKQAAKAAGLFDRPEWESRVTGGRPEPEALAATPLAGLLGPDRIRKLVPVVESRVDRTIWRLDHQESAIELVLDEGRISGGGEERTLHEVEIELKSGRLGAVLDLARRLAECVPFRIGVLSKAERGFALAEGRLDAVSKAEPVAVGEEMNVAEGFTAIVHACLRHFRLNEPLVARRREPEALHQARVAMRRLRSAFSLFRPALGGDDYEKLREELRWFTGKLGEARNLDVFLAGRSDADAADRAKLEAAREQAYDRVIEALDSRRFRDLMLGLVAWTDAGAWRERRKALNPLPGFARARLDRLWRKVRHSGRNPAALGEEDRHRLRIEIKKLRYAVEFLAGLFGSSGLARKRFGGALEAMQESLGHLNDLVTARALIDRLALAEAAPEADPAEEGRNLAEAARNFSRLARIGPFWR